MVVVEGGQDPDLNSTDHSKPNQIGNHAFVIDTD